MPVPIRVPIRPLCRPLVAAAGSPAADAGPITPEQIPGLFAWFSAGAITAFADGGFKASPFLSTHLFLGGAINPRFYANGVPRAITSSGTHQTTESGSSGFQLINNAAGQPWDGGPCPGVRRPSPLLSPLPILGEGTILGCACG
jgi:hypothetical protein